MCSALFGGSFHESEFVCKILRKRDREQNVCVFVHESEREGGWGGGGVRRERERVRERVCMNPAGCMPEKV